MCIFCLKFSKGFSSGNWRRVITTIVCNGNCFYYCFYYFPVNFHLFCLSPFISCYTRRSIDFFLKSLNVFRSINYRPKKVSKIWYIVKKMMNMKTIQKPWLATYDLKCSFDRKVSILYCIPRHKYFIWGSAVILFEKWCYNYFYLKYRIFLPNLKTLKY